MNGFSCFVLYVTVTIQAECKRYQQTGKTDQFRRLYGQLKPPLSFPTQQIPGLIRLTPGLQPMGQYEVFTIKKDLHEAETKPPVAVKVDTVVKKQDLQETQSIKRTPEVIKNAKQLLVTPQKLKEVKKSQGLRNGKQLMKKPKKLNEKQKKAIRARYYQRERNDVLDLERQKVEELKKKVKRLQINLNSSKTKNKTKNLLHTDGHQGDLTPLMRSNLEYAERMRLPRRIRKKPKSSPSSSTALPMKSRFYVQTNTEKTTSTIGTSASPKVKKTSDSSSSNDEEPVMRGADKGLDDDDDEELNFDVEGEFLSHIFK